MLPLEGIKVVDLSVGVLGPAATTMLADWGAEVIKVEERHHGDVMRGLAAAAFGVNSPPVNSYASFLAWDRNRRSIALDITKPKGREILSKMVKSSDVFVQNFRPSASVKLKIDYETISKENPRIIYAWPSGFGHKGPKGDKPAFDLLIQAMSGFMRQVGDPDDQPFTSGPFIFDTAAAMALACGIMTALYVRERTGIGQKVETSLLGAAIFAQANYINYNLLTGNLLPRSSRGQTMIAGLSMTFKTKDGWLAMAGVPDQRWPGFCRALGIQHIMEDPKFKTSNSRIANRDDLVALLDKVFLTKSRDEWVKLLEEADQMVAPVNTYAELAADPQALANGYICQFDDPVKGPTKLTGMPVELSKTPGKIRCLPPDLGEHTNEILQDFGYSWEEIAQFTSDEVVGFAARS